MEAKFPQEVRAAGEPEWLSVESDFFSNVTQEEDFRNLAVLIIGLQKKILEWPTLKSAIVHGTPTFGQLLHRVQKAIPKGDLQREKILLYHRISYPVKASLDRGDPSV